MPHGHRCGASGRGCRAGDRARRGNGARDAAARKRSARQRSTRMSTATMSMTEARSGPDLERVTVWLLLAFVASLQISIAAANILLAITLVCWVTLLVRERKMPSVPFFFWPLLAYAGATLVAAA